MDIDYQHFKVICQNCGKTGVIDFAKPQKENEFMRRFGRDRNGNKFEYYMCKNCFSEEFSEYLEWPRSLW